jgi:hypothetical protein
MATNIAVPTQGTTFKFGTTPTDVADVVSWSGPRFDRSDIDVTHLGSDAKEYLAGLKDPGEFSMEVNMNLNDPGQKLIWDALDDPTPQPVAVTFPDPGGSLAFSATVKGFETAGNADDKITGSITLRISGDVPWTAPTP